MKYSVMVLAFFAMLGVRLLAQPTTRPDAIDWDRARALHQREVRGESLSTEDQAYLDRAKAAHRAMERPANGQSAPPTPAPPVRESTGLVPLTQMGPDEKYKGVSGGLYGDGKNTPPEKLIAAAMESAKSIQPLDSDGKPSADGKIVLMSIGMSNTTMEYQRFKQLADADPAKGKHLLIVDGAQGGQDAVQWDTTRTTGEHNPWLGASQRLTIAGASPKQVQVIWLKQAMAGPSRFGEFPKHADVMKQHVESAIALAKEKFPNLKLVYLSSRIYAGYATTPLNPEPYAYEGAFAMRGVIDDQMKGDLQSPIVLWGPYLWADGVKGRQMDDLVWKPEDFAKDGTHPSASGQKKVADLLLKFFKSDPTAKPWFSQ